jgi:adenylosuccinate lyase
MCIAAIPSPSAISLVWYKMPAVIARYSRPELAALWDEGYRYELWLEIELAACAAMERAGIVPAGNAEKVRAAAQGKLDPARIRAIEATTRHDVIAFLAHVEELAGEPARWLHHGMTSSDVLDTSLAMQTGRALDRVIAAALALANAWRARESTPPRRRSVARTASTPSRSPPASCSHAGTPKSCARSAA